MNHIRPEKEETALDIAEIIKSANEDKISRFDEKDIALMIIDHIELGLIRNLKMEA